MDDPPVFLDVDAIARLHEDAGVISEVRQAAEETLRGPTFTVTSKTKIPSSGDKRDYFSLGPYWWPNPATPDGLPYVRRDGEVNPEALQTDRQVMEGMIAAVQTLAVAWTLTKDNRYAQRAAELLRIFFLDEKTRMNPNLNFGQAVPGHCDGRGIGIIDTRVLAGLLDHVRLLRDAHTVDEAGLQAWFRAFNRWLCESPLGIAEANEHNNHGTWYDVQVAALALYTGETEIARQILQQVGPRRIDTHIAPDGSQPHEIARTLGLSYSTMNLVGFFWMGKLGERMGVNAWTHGTKSVRAALDYLVPFWMEPAAWAQPQIKPFDQHQGAAILLAAAEVWPDGGYRQQAERLGANWMDILRTGGVVWR